MSRLSIARPVGWVKQAINTLAYRVRHHLLTMIISAILTGMTVLALSAVVGMIYPDFGFFLERYWPFNAFSHCKTYTIFSGEKGGVYGIIGKVVTAHHDTTFFDDNDTLINVASDGGYDNFMKATNQRNTFGLVQDAVLNLQQASLRNNALIAAPLFYERLHIFYRKSLFAHVDSGGSDGISLSANVNDDVLRCFRDNVSNVQVGIVGSCTRVIADDIMDIIDRQIEADKQKIDSNKSSQVKIAKAMPRNKFRHRVRIDSSLQRAFAKLTNFDPRKKLPRDSIIDIMFYVGADPTKNIVDVLEKGQYGLMSIHPSLINQLNKDYKLGLVISDFRNKYQSADHCSTAGTICYLVASRDVPADDVQRMLKRIQDSSTSIHKCLMCDSCCAAVASGGAGANSQNVAVMPLNEFGFCRYFQQEDREKRQEQNKAMIPFVIAMFSFFFPIVKSVRYFKSTILRWQHNKEIDLMMKADPVNPCNQIERIKDDAITQYSNGELIESDYNALLKRIEMICGKLAPAQTSNVFVVGPSDGVRVKPYSGLAPDAGQPDMQDV